MKKRYMLLSCAVCLSSSVRVGSSASTAEFDDCDTAVGCVAPHNTPQTRSESVQTKIDLEPMASLDLIFPTGDKQRDALKRLVLKPVS